MQTRLFLLMFAVLPSACGPAETGDPGNDAEAPVDPLTWSPREPGDFACGHQEVEITYTPPSATEPRTIPVHVWYPSNVAEGTHPKYRGIFVDDVAWEGTPLAPSPWKQGFPVWIHSHGYKGFAGNSHRLMCHAASHGWVAIAPEHVGNTLSDTPDPLPLILYIERPWDLRAALDAFGSTEGVGDFAGKLDLARVAMSGHSFGSYTAWAMAGAAFDAAAIDAKCAANDVGPCSDAEKAVFPDGLGEARISAAIPMAGGENAFFGDNGYDAAKVPVLLMSGSLDPVGADTLFDKTTGVDLTWVDVEGGCHQLYGLGNSVLGDQACTGLPDEEGFSIVNPIALAFARVRVLGDTNEEAIGIAEGSVSLSDRATLQRKAK